MQINKAPEILRSWQADYICNLCGKSCMKELDGTEPVLKEFYGARVRIDGGYCSTAIPDGISYSFELCEKCVADLMKKFKHPPEEFHNLV